MEQLEALRAFVSRRSGIDWRNYGDRASFMCDYRRIPVSYTHLTLPTKA